MASKMENPAARRGNPVVDIAASSIDPEFISQPAELQARRLQRIHRLSVPFALAVAEIVFAGCPR